MEGLLQSAAVAALCALAGEFCLYLLPGGSMRQVCRFVAGLVLAVQLLALPLKLDMDTLLQTEYTQPPVIQQSYEDVIWDVYNDLMENKNG